MSFIISEYYIIFRFHPASQKHFDVEWNEIIIITSQNGFRQGKWNEICVSVPAVKFVGTNVIVALKFNFITLNFNAPVLVRLSQFYKVYHLEFSI